MADDILDHISRYKGPEKLPPIAAKAYDLYVAGGNKLDASAQDALRQDLRATYGDLKVLTDTVLGLGVFGIYVKDNLKDPVTGEAVAVLIRETAPQYAAIGERIVSALQDIASKATGVLDRFTNRNAERRPRAPRFGEAAPAGSVPLKAMMPPQKKLRT